VSKAKIWPIICNNLETLWASVYRLVLFTVIIIIFYPRYQQSRRIELRYAKKLEWPLVLLLGKAIMLQNNCIKPLSQNRESLKQKASLSIIAWLERNLAKLRPRFDKFASRVVDRTERLYDNRLKRIDSMSKLCTWRTAEQQPAVLLRLLLGLL